MTSHDPTDGATRAEVERALADGSAVVVDIMEDASYRVQHIPGAWTLPLSLLPRRARSVLRDPARPVIVYCAGYT